MKNTFLITTVLFVILSCSKSSSDGVENPTDKVEVLSMELPEYEPSDSDAVPEPKENLSREYEVKDQKIIKRAKLRFETSNTSQTAQSIISIVKKNNGFVERDEESKDYENFYRTIIVRVPNQNFEKICNETMKGIAYFDEKVITTEDVTASYIDVEARLKAKRELEDRYLQLLSKANKVSDMLEIENELSSIREEIESKQRTLTYMQNRVSLSTIEYVFYKPSVSSGVTVSYGDKMANALKSSINWIPGFGLWILSVWPFLLLFGLLVVYFVRKKRKNKKTD